MVCLEKGKSEKLIKNIYGVSKLAFCFHSADWFDGLTLSLLGFLSAATLNTEILSTLPAAEMLLMPGLAFILMVGL